MQFRIRVRARGDNVRWSSSVHEFSQICGPNSATLYSAPLIQRVANTAKDVGLPSTSTKFEYFFTAVASNNPDCNTITTGQTISTTPSYPGSAHPAITLQTAALCTGAANPCVLVNDNTKPQVINFYIIA